MTQVAVIIFLLLLMTVSALNKPAVSENKFPQISSRLQDNITQYQRAEMEANEELEIIIGLGGDPPRQAINKIKEKYVISKDIESEEEISVQETVPTSPTQVELSLSKAPALDEISEITATIRYTGKIREHMYNSEVIANITLPDGLELINGNLTWKGHLRDIENKSQEFSITVKAVKIGNWTIKATAGREHLGRGFDYVYISVFENKGMISKEPFPLPKIEDSDRAIKMDESEIPPETEPPPTNITIPEPTEPIENGGGS